MSPKKLSEASGEELAEFLRAMANRVQTNLDNSAGIVDQLYQVAERLEEEERKQNG